jgi:methylthioribulose-1-phosphate dehydratase
VPPRFPAVARQLAAVGRRFYARGWAFGTSGNFSAVLTRQPLSIAITASGRPKGALEPADMLRCDERGRAIGRTRQRPSAETLLHIEIARLRRAGAVLHTHSVWSTMLSDLHSAAGGMTIQGYEMLKGLAGVTSHEHSEWIPIVENDQDIPRLARRIEDTLRRSDDAHAFLLQRHGLYTWGDTIADAERHVEILEFLFETVGRTMAAHGQPARERSGAMGAPRATEPGSGAGRR